MCNPTGLPIEHVALRPVPTSLSTHAREKTTWHPDRTTRTPYVSRGIRRRHNDFRDAHHRHPHNRGRHTPVWKCVWGLPQPTEVQGPRCMKMEHRGDSPRHWVLYTFQNPRRRVLELHWTIHERQLDADDGKSPHASEECLHPGSIPSTQSALHPHILVSKNMVHGTDCSSP